MRAEQCPLLHSESVLLLFNQSSTKATKGYKLTTIVYYSEKVIEKVIKSN